MKKKIVSMVVGVFVLGSLGLGETASAADINYGGDTNISVNGMTFAILAGSTATSLVVNANTFTVSVPSGSTFIVRSADRYLLTNDGGFAQLCNATAGTNTVTLNGTIASVTFTPVASVCADNSTPGGGTGGNTGGSSGSATPAPSVTTAPGAPTIGTAVAGNAKATVTFTAPSSNGGSAITGYTVTSNPGSFTATGSTSPLVVSGLTNGTAYTFTVKATNAIGTSVASSATNSVTPSATAAEPATPATPATPADTTTNPTTPAVPATPATPATPSSEASAVAQLATIRSEAQMIDTSSNADIAKAANATANDTAEKKTADTLLASITKGITVSADAKAEMNAFITYGTLSTFKLGAGERAGVLNSYKSAFGSLPATEADWSDALKIANGRFPTKTSKTAEDRAKVNFKLVYKRAPDMKQANDSAAVTVMAYGLRSVKRNMASEAASLKSFKAIYGKNASTAREWDVVRAIAYSGAKR